MIVLASMPMQTNLPSHLLPHVCLQLPPLQWHALDLLQMQHEGLGSGNMALELISQASLL